MSLGHGTRLGTDDNLAPLEVRGLGEAYLASDTRLGRYLALKLLADRYKKNPSRVRRFEPEVRAASATPAPEPNGQEP